MNRILSKKKLLNRLSQDYKIQTHEDLVEVLTPWVQKIGEKNGRFLFFYEDYMLFGVFSCGKNFTNIRFLKKPAKIKNLTEIKEKIRKNRGEYVPGSEGFFNNLYVQQFFTIIDNIPVTYWVNEKGEIYGIEAV